MQGGNQFDKDRWSSDLKLAQNRLNQALLDKRESEILTLNQRYQLLLGQASFELPEDFTAGEVQETIGIFGELIRGDLVDDSLRT